MASERQIAANRHNAQKSSGPKSDAGKKRSSENAYRHGLTVPISTVESVAQLKELSRQLAGDTADVNILTLSDRAADAQLDLARVRRIQSALIERVLKDSAFRDGTFDPQEELRAAQADSSKAEWQERPPQPDMLDAFTALPPGKEDRPFTSDVELILAELIKTFRYEKRAAGRRDRAISKIASASSRLDNLAA